jgi:hypothetical protein
MKILLDLKRESCNYFLNLADETERVLEKTDEKWEGGDSQIGMSTRTRLRFHAEFLILILMEEDEYPSFPHTSALRYLDRRGPTPLSTQT